MATLNQHEAAQRIQALRQEIRYHNELYYNQDAPEISDAAYDALSRELKALEKEFPALVTKDSPTQNVGGKAASSTFRKVQHRTPLLSLQDIFNLDEVNEWFQTTAQKRCVTVEQKIDGLSMAVTYTNGKLVCAATRGDGHIGEDVTANAIYIDGIPTELTLPAGVDSENDITVRCEVIMPIMAFEAVNADLKKQGKKLFANPRNAAAGSLRVKDPMVTKARGLKAIAFQIMNCHGWDKIQSVPAPMKTQYNDLELLAALGFHKVPYHLCENIHDVETAIQAIADVRPSLPYWIDGAVIKVADIPVHQQMGETAKHPHWAVAYKYPPEQKETVVRDIVVQTGRTGVITPVAVFDPVLLCGTSVERATLHNQQFMDNVLHGVAVGDTIVVHKSGEIIPEVLSVDHSKRPAGTKPFTITHCPVCGAEAVLATDENGNGSNYICSNDACPAKLEKHLIYWASKHVMDIDGLGPSIISSLIDNGSLSDVVDLYRLDAEMLNNEPAVGPVRGAKLLAAIETSKHRDIDRLIAGLGMSGVGRSTGKLLASQYKNIWEIAHLTKEQLMTINGIGKITADVIVSFFSKAENLEMIQELELLGVNTTSQSAGASKADGIFAGKSFVITGTLSVPRDVISERITANGGTVMSGVSKKTSILVAGEAAGSKLQKAKDLGIPIWSEDDLQNQLI